MSRSTKMSEPIVKVLSGQLRGVVEKHEDGFDYFAFKGVPYAETPTGELRFKEKFFNVADMKYASYGGINHIDILHIYESLLIAYTELSDPVPKKSWTGIRDATKYGPRCAQYEPLAKVKSDEEDCLHLNVFTRIIGESNARKAVLVWIHGGAFFFGCCDDLFCGPDYLIRKDIVLVTVHYRLGVFGFLDLKDGIAPGNQGLKDQVMALQWIKNNIDVFGGDPNNVTIAGESAGGVSVHYLSLSPLAEGLFHKAIIQSGVVFNPWASLKNPKQNAIKLCSLLGKELEDSKEIVEFLKTIDTKTLREGQENLRKVQGMVPFGPGIDDKSPNPFMPIPAEISAKPGVHVPCLVGYNSREGLFFLNEISKKDFFKMLNENFGLILRYRTTEVLERHNLSTQQFRRLYYKSEEITEKNWDTFADLFSDLFFVEGMHKFVRIQSEQSSASTYMYQFSYDSQQSITKTLVSNAPSGVGHFDDVPYLFKMRFYDQIGLEHPSKGTDRYKVMEQMTEMWTNFAKYGKPTIKTSDLIPVHWQPISDGTVLRYLNIDEDLTMQSTLNIDQKYSSASTTKV